MKVCITCLKPKEDSEFGFIAHSRKKRRNTCQECRREYNKNHYVSHKASYIAKAKKFNKKQRDENRQKILAYLSGKSCLDCGNSDVRVLEFDHKKKKRNNISNMIYRNSWPTILKEIGKCEIRCANCHRIKTVTQFGWFKTIESR